MIKKLAITGFKSFDQVELNLKNFTLLAGQNSVGKTTVLQVIFTLLQEGKNPFRGNYMNIGTLAEVQNAITKSQKVQLVMEYEQMGLLQAYGKVIDKSGMRSSGIWNDKMKVIYCSADRIGVRDTYEKYIGDNIIIGKNCEYAFHYLSAHEEDELDPKIDFIYDESTKLTFSGQVDYWLDRIMGYRIKAREIDKTEFIRVLYANGKVPFEMRPKNIGTGVTYIAEIIIAALACKEGDLLVVENPEIHLHPSGQAELVKFFAFLAQCGLQIIVETHSDHIYNGIRKSIRLDEIDSENVAIYFFKQDERGCSIPVEVPVNEKGKALADPEGMFDQIGKDLDTILGW